jgi:Dyp-type peroxidase family/Carbohydrate-selective porin, OprB family
MAQRAGIHIGRHPIERAGRSPRLAIGVGCVCALFGAASAPAAEPADTTTPVSTAAADDNGVAPEADLAIKAQPAGQWTGVWSRSALLGDMGGLRPALLNYGVSFGLQESSEYLGNLTGGINRGATYDGLTTAALSVDTQKAFGLAGGTFNISALQIHGRNLSQYNLGNLQTASGIEADDATRLWELWYQQSFLDNKFDVRVGQQSIDQEFMVSQYSSTFVNTMFGWPAVPSYDMPAGGPAWMKDGTYTLVRRIRITLEHWDKMEVGFQEQVVGRRKYRGAPLGKHREFEAADLDAKDAYGNSVVPDNAHIRLSAAQTNGGAQILRRGYWYNDGANFYVERRPPWRQEMEYDAGLLFIAHQRDPRTGFIKINRNLALGDIMNQFSTHVGSGIFGCPPGASEGSFIGAALFDGLMT